MSTAYELRIRINAAMDEPFSQRMTAYYRIAGEAIDRLAKLERGSEKASECAMESNGFWFDGRCLGLSHDNPKRVAYPSLLGLIESLGEEKE